MAIRLTKKRLNAIIESLTSRLAGEIDIDDAGIKKEDYEEALDWALSEEALRSRKSKSK